MNCIKCGAEVANDVKFCTNCGVRLDGKVVCPKCKAENDEGSKFCKECGKLLIETKICKKCKTELSKESVFCPNCGEKYGEKPLKTNKEKSKVGFLTVEKILTPSLLLFGLFFIMLCSLLMGTRVTVGGTAKTLLSNFIAYEEIRSDVFYFFGDVYKELFTTFEVTSVREVYFSVAFPLILMTVTLALNIILSVIMLTIGAVKLGKGFYKKQEVNIGKYFAWAFAGFLFSLGLMISYGGCAEIVVLKDITKASVIIKMIPTGFTICGLIIVLAVGFATLVLKTVSKCMVDFDVKLLLNKIFTLLICVFTAISFIAFSKNFINGEILELGTTSTSLSLGALSSCSSLGEENMLRYMIYTQKKAQGMSAGLVLLAEGEVILQVVAYLIFAGIVAVQMGFAIKSLLDKKQHSIITLVLSSVATLCAIGIMVLVGSSSIDLLTTIGYTDDTYSSIAGIIFSALSLGVAFASLCIKPENEIEE